MFSFADVHRGRPIYLLALLFVVVAIAVGRMRGLAALAGLVFAGAALLLFTIPALILGTSPTLVALVTGGAICLVSLPLAHGFSMRSAVAILGSLTGMSTAAVISALSVHALHLTGLSSDEAAYLATLGSRSSVSGLLLCGTVIGAIGVLNDVTVTQASAVYELAAAAPDLGRTALSRAATRIGRDHIAATIYSLVLAYAGSALPLLLLFSVTDQSVITVLTSDAFAPEVVSGLIGATALVLVVPFTTVIAALLVTPRHAKSQAGGHTSPSVGRDHRQRVRCEDRQTHDRLPHRPADARDPTLLAHAFGQRYTLPLPLLLFVLGGAVVVGASFLIVLPRAVPAATDHDRRRPRPARTTPARSWARSASSCWPP